MILWQQNMNNINLFARNLIIWINKFTCANSYINLISAKIAKLIQQRNGKIISDLMFLFDFNVLMSPGMYSRLYM